MPISPVSVLPSLFCQPQAPVTCFANELLLEIFSRLKAHDLLSVTSTCKRFYEIKKDRSLWEALFKQDFPRLMPDPERSFFSQYVCNNAAWKRVPPFLDIPTEFEFGICDVTVHNTLLIAVGENNPIKIWNKDTGILQHTLEGHPDLDVKCIYVQDDLVISHAGPDTGTLETKVWSLEGVLLHTLYCSTLFVIGLDRLWGVSSDFPNKIKIWNKMNGVLINSIDENIDMFILDEDLLISGGLDGVVKIWDTKEYELICEVGEFQEGLRVTRLVVDQEYVLAAYKGGFIKKWSKMDGAFISTIEPHSNDLWVFSLTIVEEVLIGEYSDGTFIAWDKNDFSPLYRFGNCRNFIFIIEKHALVVGCEDGSIQIRDVRTGNIMLILPGHPSKKIYKLIIDGNRLISYGSSDWTGKNRDIKIWNRDTGDLLLSLDNHCLRALGKDCLVTSCLNEGIRIWDFSVPLGISIAAAIEDDA